ncbi:MAG: GtrA family protein [Gammaproteobacteria bacterium]
MSAGPAPSIVRFGLVGLVNTAVGLAVIAMASRLLGAGEYLANACGLVAGIVVGYQLNRHWTFASPERAVVTAPRYVLAFAGAYATNLAVLAAGLRWLSLDPLFAQAAALVTYSGVFYLLCRHAVFREAR